MPSTASAIRRFAPVVTAASLCVSVLAAPAVSAATPERESNGRGTVTRVLANCRRPVYEPARVILACGDYTAFITIRHYDTWSDDAASGRGYLHVNRCVPDCAHGRFERLPAQLRLDRPVVNVTGQRVFSRLTIKFVDGARRGTHFVLQTDPAD